MPDSGLFGADLGGLRVSPRAVKMAAACGPGLRGLGG